jgi:geranylgeranyl diphosphate synthase type II|nr:MAG: polyprenyl synthetase [Bacteroidota bacterium]
MSSRAYLQNLQEQIESYLRRAIPRGDVEALYEPARYVLEAGGKRLRPLLVLLACEAHGGRAGDALPAAAAVELFHSFTLVHDDIMDHSETRRGRPTVHMRWGAEAAILAGDLLMGLSYFELSRAAVADVRPLIGCLHLTMLRLCEGQMLDKTYESRQDVSIAEYWEMVDRKTGALLAGALEIGARIGGASEADLEGMRQMGWALGRAFQLQDDYLDLMADPRTWGKPIGQDILEGKRTYLLLAALERARGASDRALLDRILGRRSGPEDVTAARELYARLGVLREAEALIRAYYAEARSMLQALPPSPARDGLEAVMEELSGRLR